MILSWYRTLFFFLPKCTISYLLRWKIFWCIELFLHFCLHLVLECVMRLWLCPLEFVTLLGSHIVIRISFFLRLSQENKEWTDSHQISNSSLRPLSLLVKEERWIYSPYRRNVFGTAFFTLRFIIKCYCFLSVTIVRTLPIVKSLLGVFLNNA